MSECKPGIHLQRSLCALTLLLSTAATAANTDEDLYRANEALSRHLLDLGASGQPRASVAPATSRYAGKVPADRWALPMASDVYGDSAQRIRYLDQGWSPELSMLYYFTDQGSQLVDYGVFVNMERADSQELFSTPASLTRFRYLQQKPSPGNPDALPVGFLKRTTPEKDYLSITCAACHTGQINYQGTGIRIDGAGAQADFVGFLDATRQALEANLNQTDKFYRLASRMLGKNPSATGMQYLKARLTSSLHMLETYTSINRSDLRDGFARVDAIGRIYNQVLRAVHAGRYLTPDAPVSYPFIWDAPHHDYVQWLGLTPNAGPGALGRNAGEVIGVFGDISVTHQSNKLEKLTGYRSSVQAGNLVDYEKWLWALQSPQWPQDVLPQIDQSQASAGRKLYVEQCLGCHRDIQRADPKRLVYAQMYGLDVVGTDPREISNALRSGNTGVLKGALTGLTSNQRYAATAPVALMLSDLVTGTLLKNVDASLKATRHAREWGLGVEGATKQGQYPLDPNNPNASLAAYKARPLNGIWATAPYLHNGSVPSLYDLLLPASQRPLKFAVGQLEFDPVKVGHKQDPNDPQAPFVFDTRLPGNSNQGHEFGGRLSEPERLQLLEYLKTL